MGPLLMVTRILDPNMGPWGRSCKGVRIPHSFSYIAGPHLGQGESGRMGNPNYKEEFPFAIPRFSF